MGITAIFLLSLKYNIFLQKRYLNPRGNCNSFSFQRYIAFYAFPGFFFNGSFCYLPR